MFWAGFDSLRSEFLRGFVTRWWTLAFCECCEEFTDESNFDVLVSEMVELRVKV